MIFHNDPHRLHRDSKSPCFLPFLAAAAPILGAGIGAAADIHNTNSTNAANAAEAQKNRDFQAHQAATAHQRETADLEAAGLNRALGYMKGSGGAATPNGNVATMQRPDTGTFIAKMGASAADAANLLADLKNKESQNALLAAQAGAANAQAVNALASAEATRTEMPSIMEKSRSARSEADANIAEAQARQRHGEIDRDWATFDAVTKRVYEGVGNTAGAIGKIFRGGGKASGGNPGKSTPRQPRPGTPQALNPKPLN